MEKTKIFKLDQNNRYVRSLNKGFVYLGIYPLVTLVSLLLFFAGVYLISRYTTNFIIEWIGNNGLVVMEIFIFIAILQMLYGILKIRKNLKIKNSLIIKEGNDILLLYRINEINQSAALAINVGRLMTENNNILGLGLYVVGIKNAKVLEIKEKNKPAIEKIIDDPRSKYELYSNCKLLKETKKYYLFNGDNIDYAGKIKNKNFKIYKIYSKIEKIVKD